MKKVGITFEPPSTPTEIFSNGIKQNALYLNELLTNCGFDSFLVVPKNDIQKLNGLYGFKSTDKYLVYEDIPNSDLDVLIQFTFQVDLKILKSCKQRGIKLVAYKCGNDYTLDLEATLHLDKSERIPQYHFLYNSLPIFDQIWSIPQMVNTNLHYWKTLYKCEVLEVPFVWSPSAMQQFEVDCIKSGSSNLIYKNRGERKKISIFEPNIGVIKWFFPALLVCENAYRLKSNIDFIYLTNMKGDKLNLDLVNQIVSSLDLFKDKKISVEGRYNSLYFMSSHSDICVSHQWENPLNYLYLDLAWFGWPVVHNAHLCKDIGYYYEGFNYEEGGRVLDGIIRNHDKNIDNYIERNRNHIDRYLPTNKKLQSDYKKLVERLFK